MKIIPNLIQQAKVKTKNWTQWDNIIYGAEEFHGGKGVIVGTRRRSAMMSNSDWYNIYISKLNQHIVEKTNNEISIRELNKIEPIIKFKI